MTYDNMKKVIFAQYLLLYSRGKSCHDENESFREFISELLGHRETNFFKYSSLNDYKRIEHTWIRNIRILDFYRPVKQRYKVELLDLG